MKRYFTLILILTTLLITSCSLLFPPKPLRLQQYVLTMPINTFHVKQYSTQKVLGINPVIAPVWLATSQMAYQLQPNTLNYFAVNQWLAAPAQLLQPIIIYSLQQANIYRAIVTLPTPIKVSQQLSLRLLNMQQEFWQINSNYHLTLQAVLTHDNTLIATKYFDLTLPAQTATPAAGAIAANQAVAELMPQLINFCRRHVT